MAHKSLGMWGQKKALWAACVLCLSLAGIAYLWPQYKGVLVLVNHADEDIFEVKVDVCGQFLRFEGIPRGERRAVPFQLCGDSDYDIIVRFASGRRIRTRIGYATSGLDWTEVMVVTPETVKFEDE